MDIPLSTFKDLKPLQKTAKDLDSSHFAAELVNMDSRILCSNMLNSNMDELECNPTNHFYIPTKNFIIIPAVFPYIEHQIAHMVEMNNLERCLMPDWGFDKVDSVQKRVDNSKGPFFIAVFMREMRVRAIQRHVKASYHGSVLNHFTFRDIMKYLPFGRFKTEKDVKTFVYDQEEKIYNSWSQERIRNEWIIRLNHIQNWMETKEVAMAALRIKEMFKKIFTTCTLIFCFACNNELEEVNSLDQDLVWQDTKVIQPYLNHVAMTDVMYADIYLQLEDYSRASYLLHQVLNSSTKYPNAPKANDSAKVYVNSALNYIDDNDTINARRIILSLVDAANQ